MGQVTYIIVIILMLSVTIFMLMLRSANSFSNTVEFEALLDAMRFREELDLRKCHKRRLMNAKQKVVTWLLKNRSIEAQAMCPVHSFKDQPSGAPKLSYVPEIVIISYNNSGERQRFGQGSRTGIAYGSPCCLQSHSPAVSMVFNFDDPSDSTKLLATQIFRSAIVRRSQLWIAKVKQPDRLLKKLLFWNSPEFIYIIHENNQ